MPTSNTRGPKRKSSKRKRAIPGDIPLGYTPDQEDLNRDLYHNYDGSKIKLNTKGKAKKKDIPPGSLPGEVWYYYRDENGVICEEYLFSILGRCYSRNSMQFIGSINQDGYVVVGLTINGKKRTPKLHTVMSELMLIKNPEQKKYEKESGKKLTVDHGDRVRHNNHIDNLCNATEAEQALNRNRTRGELFPWRDGMYSISEAVAIEFGKRDVNSKFDSDVCAIRSYIKECNLTLKQAVSKRKEYLKETGGTGRTKRTTRELHKLVRDYILGLEKGERLVINLMLKELRICGSTYQKYLLPPIEEGLLRKEVRGTTGTVHSYFRE